MRQPSWATMAAAATPTMTVPTLPPAMCELIAKPQRLDGYCSVSSALPTGCWGAPPSLENTFASANGPNDGAIAWSPVPIPRMIPPTVSIESRENRRLSAPNASWIEPVAMLPIAARNATSPGPIDHSSTIARYTSGYSAAWPWMRACWIESRRRVTDGSTRRAARRGPPLTGSVETDRTAGHTRLESARVTAPTLRRPAARRKIASWRPSRPRTPRSPTSSWWPTRHGLGRGMPTCLALRSIASTASRSSSSSAVRGFFSSTGGGPTDDKPSVTLAPPGDPDRRDNLFTIRVNDCAETYELLRGRGATFLTPPVVQGSETRCFFRDPDGHLFEISEYRG